MDDETKHRVSIGSPHNNDNNSNNHGQLVPLELVLCRLEALHIQYPHNDTEWMDEEETEEEEDYQEFVWKEKDFNRTSSSSTPDETFVCRLVVDQDISSSNDHDDNNNNHAIVSSVLTMGSSAWELIVPPWVQAQYHRSFGTTPFPNDPVTNHQASTIKGFWMQVTQVVLDEPNVQLLMTPHSEFVPVARNNSTTMDGGQSEEHGEETNKTQDHEPDGTNLRGLRVPPTHDGSNLTRRHPTNTGSRSLSSSSAPGMGSRTVVVLRVSYLDWEPTWSASELQGRVFGRGTDKVDISLRSHMAACSRNQVTLQVHRGSGIVHGIVEIRISQAMTFGQNPIRQLENKALALAANKIGRLDRIDHIMVVLPDASSILSPRHNYVAYGYLFGQVTVYHDVWGGYYSALVHEWGHNVGLHHSGARRRNRNNQVQLEEYGDTSGLMGYSFRQVSGPAMCFNAQKHYLLQWFQGRTRRVDAVDLPWTGNLVFFGDDSPSNQYPVLIHLSRPGLRLFLQYNQAVEINEGTKLMANHVVVVQDRGQPGDRTTILPSLYVGAIATGGRGMLRYRNYQDSKDLLIRVCRRYNNGTPPFLRLHISLVSPNSEVLDNDQVCDTVNPNDMPPFCDDDRTATFYVDSDRGTKDCAWLRRHPTNINLLNRLCRPSHAAYHACAETCGNCTDNFRDRSTGTFFVNSQLGRKDCAWLSTQSLARQDALCYSGHRAFAMCHETCDRCD